MTNENNFSNKNVAFVAVAVFVVFAGVTSMMFINTEPTDEDRTSNIETIEVVAEPAEEAEPEVVEDVEVEETEPVFDEANNIMTDNHEH